MELLVYHVNNDADGNQCCGDTYWLLESWSEPISPNHVQFPVFRYRCAISTVLTVFFTDYI